MRTEETAENTSIISITRILGELALRTFDTIFSFHFREYLMELDKSKDYKKISNMKYKPVFSKSLS